MGKLIGGGFFSELVQRSARSIGLRTACSKADAGPAVPAVAALLRYTDGFFVGTRARLLITIPLLPIWNCARVMLRVQSSSPDMSRCADVFYSNTLYSYRYMLLARVPLHVPVYVMVNMHVSLLVSTAVRVSLMYATLYRYVVRLGMIT